MLDSLMKTRTRRAWKGFSLVCFFVFVFALSRVIFIELISCWIDLPKG